MPTLVEAPADTGRRPNTLRLRCGRELVVERVNGRKASQALKLLRRVNSTVKAVTTALGEFERDYARSHSVELDRVQARMRYPRRPLLDADTGDPVREPDALENGEPNPRAGDLILVDSPLDHLTPEDWERAGHVVRLPLSPSTPERIGAVFDVAVDGAEDEVWKLLALLTMSNEDLRAQRRRHDGPGIDAVLAELAEDLLDDAELDELLELAVIAGETIDDQFRRKLAELEDRAGNALRLLGLAPAQEEEQPQTAREEPRTTVTFEPHEEPREDAATTPSNGRPTSSTDSPEASPDGTPTPSLSSHMTSSSPSANASTSSA